MASSSSFGVASRPLTLVAFVILQLIYVRAQYLQSPCPDVFTYQVDPSTNQVFGYIEINNIQIGQSAKLNVDLSIATRLAPNNVGSIVLVKSREATFNDIVAGLPAQYRVNFPLQNILPTVLSIALNGQSICTGSRAQGRVITTINLEHTLYTQIQSHGLGNGNGFQYQQPSVVNRPVLQQRPQVQYQPQQRPQIQFQPQTEPEPVWNMELQTRPTLIQRRPTTLRPVVQPDSSMVLYPNADRNTVAPPISQSSDYVCGKTSSSLNRLSINGELVSKGQFPWIVPLFDRTQPRSPKYFCGSTIITKKYLITAAHCVYALNEVRPADQILAVPGMYNIDNFFDENAKIAYIEEVIPHDDYVDDDDDLKDADVAVLRLKKELVFTDYIIPICPWQTDNDLSKIIGQEGVIAGWGLTESGSTSVPTYVKTTVVTRQQCISNLSRTYPSNWRIFCGDGRGSAPCKGDSGSAMIMKRGNQFYLRGIVSVGQFDNNSGKCNVTVYTVYTDIAPFRFWLKSVTS
ncbi:serine protease gd-like [Malaya genurostris]|uniref:serine protease gd-like n=1 Tax=Malaya genurostris TaxID=325434 RepID=UPI0026F3D80D|nr:serine protease gd-like [Malaya genurostris]